MSRSSELKKIASMLRRLAQEGHGGSEARLVKTLDYSSHRLREISCGMDRSSKPKDRWISQLIYRFLYLILGFRAILEVIARVSG